MQNSIVPQIDEIIFQVFFCVPSDIYIIPHFMGKSNCIFFLSEVDSWHQLLNHGQMCWQNYVSLEQRTSAFGCKIGVGNATALYMDLFGPSLVAFLGREHAIWQGSQKGCGLRRLLSCWLFVIVTFHLKWNPICCCSKRSRKRNAVFLVKHANTGPDLGMCGVCKALSSNARLHKQIFTRYIYTLLE